MSLVSVIQWCPDTDLGVKNCVFFYQLRTEHQNLGSEDILAGPHYKELFLRMEIFIHVWSKREVEGRSRGRGMEGMI